MQIVLKNAAIHDHNQWGRVADILVEDGIIKAIGENLRADESYDLSGCTVMPGVIDAHMHIVTGDIEYNDAALRSWAQAGVTTLRDLGIGNDRRRHPTQEFLEYRKTVETPERAHCLTCGRFVTRENGYSHIMSDGAMTGYGCATVQDCVDAVNELIDMGCDGIKTAMDRGMFGAKDTPVLSVEQLKAIVGTARERGVWCCAHVLSAEFLPALIEAGMPELAHIPTDYVSDELLDQLAAKGVAITPTLCTINAPRPPLPEGAKPPKMPPMPKDMPPMPDTKEQEKVALDNVKRFCARGGMVAVGTDTMRMETQPHVACMPVRELQLLRQAGLSIQEVIDAATINAAIVCGVDNEVGTIEPGKQANIIAFKDALDDSFEAMSHVEFVMNRGAVIRSV